MGALAKLRASALDRLGVAADIAGLVFSVSGATVASVFGRLAVGLVLGAIALGFVLRLSHRSRSKSARAQRRPGWVAPAVAALSALEVAALVEATNLPVRFNQEGFTYGHWLLVLFIFLAAYLLQLGLASRAVGRRSQGSAA